MERSNVHVLFFFAFTLVWNFYICTKTKKKLVGVGKICWKLKHQLVWYKKRGHQWKDLNKMCLEKVFSSFIFNGLSHRVDSTAMTGVK